MGVYLGLFGSANSWGFVKLWMCREPRRVHSRPMASSYGNNQTGRESWIQGELLSWCVLSGPKGLLRPSNPDPFCIKIAGGKRGFFKEVRRPFLGYCLSVYGSVFNLDIDLSVFLVSVLCLFPFLWGQFDGVCPSVPLTI